jgi:hypothetical protein
MLRHLKDSALPFHAPGAGELRLHVLESNKSGMR